MKSKSKIHYVTYFENERVDVEAQTKTITIRDLFSQFDMLVKITPIPCLFWRKW